MQQQLLKLMQQQLLLLLLTTTTLPPLALVLRLQQQMACLHSRRWGHLEQHCIPCIRSMARCVFVHVWQSGNI
jgi:hypothetical protein